LRFLILLPITQSTAFPFRDVECPSQKAQFDRSFGGKAEQAEPTSAASTFDLIRIDTTTQKLTASILITGISADVTGEVFGISE
jgi:hypothetical protein